MDIRILGCHTRCPQLALDDLAGVSIVVRAVINATDLGFCNVEKSQKMGLLPRRNKRASGRAFVNMRRR